MSVMSVKFCESTFLNNGIFKTLLSGNFISARHPKVIIFADHEGSKCDPNQISKKNEYQKISLVCHRFDWE